ncbi:cytosolic 10-formyltetrahydrofolate dehydrogenase [Daktulosphaira vitifoliae]|uniref:cytosolic 10-formyltetrahydrofolate dehydrogenase n=1 Tax=Daktulosphaira vitifoliae TaxID=58002 RepID=UPI0021A9901B|nr:cytosolic 10-formyltetrahydrofolate dehydrogenase [Daktulosphaira vitifoliae]XP_050537435.1 cytosolic 10-formyltetrahydrofolate dehydrogenase [Daktulosphaira vitifoliae]
MSLLNKFTRNRPSRCFNLTFHRDLNVAIIGQSTFAAEVYKLLLKYGHHVVGVFTILDKGNRQDPLAAVAGEGGTPVFKIKAWRQGEKALPEVFAQYKKVNADLNVLPFCSQFIPMEVIEYPKHRSICYHPSILPKHRGVSAINWTLINGDTEAGFSIFWADDGLDTGPILLQKSCPVLPDDTVDSLYNRFLYPEGIKSMAEAVNMVADGTALVIPQSTEGSSFEPSIRKKELQKVDWLKNSSEVHNFIRGLDSSPGAWTILDGKEVKLFQAALWKAETPIGDTIIIDDLKTPGIVHDNGLLVTCSDGQKINISRLSVNGQMMAAKYYGKKITHQEVIEYTEKEKDFISVIENIWNNILNMKVEKDTNFFQSGAGSMDVVRLIEEIKEKLKLTLKNDDVFMSPVFNEFCNSVVKRSRGTFDTIKQLKYDQVEMDVNNMKLRFAKQLFINGQFVNSESGKTIDCINPADESIICSVQCATEIDVDQAVNAATRAFYGEWSEMNPRDRGALMYKVADLLDKNREELATIESIDSGAVYTLALKTHIGMSIDVWRYFAGWADKIHGQTLPISHARPNRNLAYTKKEPIGVCGIITPWNYPLMMLSWKMAACLAAGNTVVMKPTELSPLTSLKFAELSVEAGFPSGVINILPGLGSEVGKAIVEHPDIRKVGFTGSTLTGHSIMKAAAESNLKKISLELGGKSPLVIFDDCDLERSVKISMSGVFFNKGENCIAAGRVFVESNIHDKFVERVIEEIKKIKIGNPLDRDTHHGPQNHKAHLQKLINFCKKGQDEGAILKIGGKQLNRLGYFFEPTVFTGVEDHMYIAHEESFGPIMAISRFSGSDLNAVIKRANATEYGLSSGVFTKDISKALKFAEKIDAGTVFINTYNKTDVAAPFGGFKRSGFGKDLGEEALNEYLKTKCITIEY